MDWLAQWGPLMGAIVGVWILSVIAEKLDAIGGLLRDILSEIRTGRID